MITAIPNRDDLIELAKLIFLVGLFSGIAAFGYSEGGAQDSDLLCYLWSGLGFIGLVGSQFAFHSALSWKPRSQRNTL